MNFKAGRKIYFVVVIIGLLMIANAFIIYQNSKRINRNQRLLEKTAQIKMNAQGITQSLHLLDLGIRAYALLSDKEMYISPRDSALLYINTQLSFLQKELAEQDYPMVKFDIVKSSVIEYYHFIVNDVAQAIDDKEIDKAKSLIAEDRGYEVAKNASAFSMDVKAFEDHIASKAGASFAQAVNNSYWLQILLLILTMPTLIYAAFYSVRSIRYSEQLRQVEIEKSDLLKNQNKKLELLVRERTDEILASNEEISAQNEEISTQNDEIMLINVHLTDQQQNIAQKNEQLESQNMELQQAKATIEQQQALLLLRVDELDNAISRQNEDLKNTNSEMITQNSKLQQFAYIISHNLRAPIARLLGLSDLVERETKPKEKEKIIQLMRMASKELNEVITDIGEVLVIQKAGNKVLEKVNLQENLDKVRRILSKEINETKTVIQSNFSQAKTFKSFQTYIESIFLNLISNSIKYRKPNERPLINISASINNGYITLKFKDNGMGINLKRDKQNLFGLYKRFYFHVEGKGLGLYLVKTQVEALGGTIEVKSELDTGTEFIIKFRTDKELIF
jgi:signal transduction histidine kinase